MAGVPDISGGQFQDLGGLDLGGKPGEPVDFSAFGDFSQFSPTVPPGDGGNNPTVPPGDGGNNPTVPPGDGGNNPTVPAGDGGGLEPIAVQGLPEVPGQFDFGGFFGEFQDPSTFAGGPGEAPDFGDLGGVFGNFEDFSGGYQDFDNFGGEFSDLGGFFDRSDGAKTAFNSAKDLSLEDLNQLGGDFAHDLVVDLDFFGFHDLESGVVADLLHSAEQAGDVQLDGEQWKGVLGTLDHDGILGLSEGLNNSAYEALDGQGFLLLPPENAAAFFESTLLGENTDFAAKLTELGDDAHNLLAAADHDFYSQIGDKIEGVFDSIDFENLDLSVSALDGSDIGAIMAEMGDTLAAKGSDDILAALNHTGVNDLLAIEAGVASDMIASIGLDAAAGIVQFDGLVSNLTREEIIQDLGQDLTQVLDNLDFGENSGILGEFSLNALDTMTRGDLPDVSLGALGRSKLADLANSIGGSEIFTLAPKQLEEIVLTSDPIGIKLFDEDVVGGVFAGLDFDQITGFDQAMQQSAVEAAKANLLGGFGDFASIPSVDTAYDLFADAADIAQTLIEDGSLMIHGDASDLFTKSLFGDLLNNS